MRSAVAALACASLLGFAACGDDDEKTVTESKTETITTTTDSTATTDTTSTAEDCPLGDLQGQSGLQLIKATGIPCEDARQVAREFTVNCAQNDPCELDSGFTCRADQNPEADSALITCKSPKATVEIGVAG